MGRQSSRIYYQGKDHKEIYYQGHYHDAAYLTDGNGKAALVWEKIKGFAPAGIFLIESIGNRYYAVGTKSRYISKRYWFGGGSPYGLSSVQEAASENVILIKEKDGIAMVSDTFVKKGFSSSSGFSDTYSIDFIPIEGDRLDFDNAREHGLESLYECGINVIGNGNTVYGMYADTGDSTKTGFQLLNRSTQENGSVQYTQESIITTVDSGYLQFTNRIYGRSGRIFYLGAYMQEHDDIGIPFVFMGKDGGSAGLVEMKLQPGQKQYLTGICREKFMEQHPNWSGISADIEFSMPQNARYTELVTDLHKNEMFRVIPVRAYASGSYTYEGEPGTFLRQDVLGISCLKVSFDFKQMCVAGVQVLDGLWGYNDDYNLMEYDNYRLWFRRRKAGENVYEKTYLVYTDGVAVREIELEQRWELGSGASLYFNTDKPFSCFFRYGGCLYFGLSGYNYFVRVDMENGTYGEVEKNTFIRGGD